jgi:arginyl-tRNA synthetase
MATPTVLHTVRELVSQAVQQAQKDGLLQLETTPEIQIERPAKLENGDFATSLPLRLARATRINPLQLAESLVELIPDCDEIEKVVAAHPGFINFYLRDRWVQEQVEVVDRKSVV